MTKTKGFLTIAILLICVSVFGAWTSVSDGETRYGEPVLLSTYANETIYFTRSEVTGPITTAGGCPEYHGLSDTPNGCGAVAGAEIIAFYDKYFPDLVPNWVSYYPASGKYRFQDATNVPALIRQMYTLMRTNVDDVGVSRTDFLNGLSSYVTDNGYQVSYQSVMSGSKMDYTKCKNAVDNNKVIVLFTLPTTVYEISNSSDHDTIIPTNIASAHIMVIYGYVEVKYYNTSGLFRSDTYLIASVGTMNMTMGFYKPDSTTTQAAYIVNVQ